MNRYVDAEYIKAVMLNDRLMQGNAEYEQWKQKVDAQVKAMPSIDIVRCGECKYNENPCINHGEMSPRCRYANYKRSADGFCSRGERSER